MLNPAIFTRLPLKSADSTNATQNGVRNGKMFGPEISSGQGSLITAWRIETHNSRATWNQESSYLCEISQQELFD
jgi:hypothetical protein